MSSLNRQSVREQIRNVLLDRILSGHYRAGERLRELQLAEEFGSSQGPVREALRELAAQGLVVTEPHRGTHVRGITPERAGELHDVRGALECYACERIGQRMGLDWSSARGNAEAAFAAASEGNAEAYSEADTAFHRAVVEAAGNPVLLEVWDGLGLLSRFNGFTLRGRRHRSALTRLAGQHMPILEALERSDGSGAQQMLEAHLGEVRSFILEPPVFAGDEDGVMDR